MDKLIAVEFSPSLPIKDRGLFPLFGCVGETLQSLFVRARDPIHGGGIVPVRFPLLGPNSRTRMLSGTVDPLNPLHFLEEGVELRIQDVHPLKQTPVSLYKRLLLGEDFRGKDFRDLLGAECYLSTHSKTVFVGSLAAVEQEYPYGWVWKREWVAGLGSKVMPALFVEARFYGMDVAINALYDEDNFDGVVIEVIVRPWPTDADAMEGITLSRLRSDVYLVSSRLDYITHIDGAEIMREALPSQWRKKLRNSYYHNTVMAKDTAEMRKVAGEATQPAIKKESAKETSTPYYAMDLSQETALTIKMASTTSSFDCLTTE